MSVHETGARTFFAEPLEARLLLSTKSLTAHVHAGGNHHHVRHRHESGFVIFARIGDGFHLRVGFHATPFLGLPVGFGSPFHTTPSAFERSSFGTSFAMSETGAIGAIGIGDFSAFNFMQPLAPMM